MWPGAAMLTCTPAWDFVAYPALPMDNSDAVTCLGCLLGNLSVNVPVNVDLGMLVRGMCWILSGNHIGASSTLVIAAVSARTRPQCALLGASWRASSRERHTV